MQYLLIIFTAVMVSLDALITGVVLCKNKHTSLFAVLYITVINFAICLLFAFIGRLINISFAGVIGGAILIFVGIRNIFSMRKQDKDIDKDNEKAQKKSSLIMLSLTALALSLDNSVTALSFTVMSFNMWIVSAIFSLATLILLIAGRLACNIRLPKIFNRLYFVPGLFLAVVGLIKIISYFI